MTLSAFLFVVIIFGYLLYLVLTRARNFILYQINTNSGIKTSQMHCY